MALHSLTPYQGIWRDYSQPPYQSSILTLGSYQALPLLAFLSAFITYTQTRWWIVTRYMLIRICWPNRLDDSEDAKPEPSFFNVLLFILLGTIIPYLLAGGSGPAKVQTQTIDTCDRFEGFSVSALQLAQTVYTQCRLNASANAATCRYVTRIVDSQPRLNLP
ncbi:hypothetical protein BDZ45DRAFT_755916 [Acephala macrosclerotiorum]|nr:hypothetical protein BDZ45DRAFT_755916 [Acephala macrosclerotiorum]